MTADQLKIQRSFLDEFDPEVADIFRREVRRNNDGLELIASENLASPAVLAACSSIFVNKYAEGYPGKRYYGGCAHVDELENLARDRVKQLFGAEHANVQPHSGAQANQAVFMAALKPGDTFLGMSLSHGGHLSHGSKVNLSGLYYQAEAYGITDAGYIDYEVVRAKALACKPKLIVAGASAYPRIIDFQKFRQIADEVGALLMVDMAHIAGLVAGGAHPSPIPYADYVTTTTHKTLRGTRGGVILCKTIHAAAVDKAVFPGIQGGPLVHAIAAKAVGFGEALKPEFKAYAQQIVENARTLAQELLGHGLSLVSGGTDNHVMLIDLRDASLSGAEAQERLESVGITTNKNSVPNDPRKPMVTSGIRIGTPSITTRGLKTKDMAPLAKAIALVLKNEDALLPEAQRLVASLCDAYPLYDGSLHERGYLTPQH